MTDTADLRALLAAHGIDLDAYPPLLRATDICADPKRGIVGILPMQRNAFLRNVADGYIAPPQKLGGTMNVWKRADILRLLVEGPKITRRQAVAIRRAEEAARRANHAKSAPAVVNR
jgi:hypothetical protein